MAVGNQFLLGNLSDVIIRADGSDVNVRDYVAKITVKESIFVPYVRGSIVIRDTASTDFLRRINTKGGPESSVEFSFNGLEGNNKTQQQEISITHDNYKIYEIIPYATSNREKYTKISFVHKLFFINEGKSISKGYVDKKVSDIVEDLGSKLDLQWGEIEETQNSITTGLSYNNIFNHIATLLKYSIRKSNINDINYLFWQDLSNKHNFVSLGKLYEQTSGFGTDVNSGFIYGINNNLDFQEGRRLVLRHRPIGKSSLETSLTGAYSSEMLFTDVFFENNQKYINFKSKDKWNKSTHLSPVPKNESNSEFWDYVDEAILSRTYSTNTNCYCCQEKEGGQRNPIYIAPRRLSQISSFFEFGVKITVTGNSNINEVGAGKIFYLGRPLMSNPADKKQEDIFLSGKFLTSTVQHTIINPTKKTFKYLTTLNGFKDSLGEE